ncbi:MAG: SHOCT domain-containing protein [Nitrosopumilus sp.]|jgi:uncharacterized membrane protein|nr:SHOCT domain-containing protein [Nitrosopumilus sp.]MDF2423164.1 SHOCT domain-containing protein [Nitrosopumilus sp.]MDF2424122.1 SHOCT domain-containing protein [Nitrosopumilus sp.]MDF2426005.1 SHOCT domain-containing protein [Nitrosopumilus sp.]MDF2427525.1 SHOCT domain-containing protein [Nitrosopumilus sp.]
MISDNSLYIAMHFDRLSNELLEKTYGKTNDEQLSNLERRLISGEITKEEFNKMKEDLKN